MKKWWVVLALAIITLLFSSWLLSTVNIGAGTVARTKTIFGERIFANEKTSARRYFVGPRLPFTDFGTIRGEFLVQDLTRFEIETSLWTKDLWTDDSEDVGQERKIKMSVELKILDWEKFLDIFDPEKLGLSGDSLGTAGGRVSARRTLIELAVKQWILQKADFSSMALEFRSRFNWASGIAQARDIRNRQDIEKFIKEELPWRWGLGILDFEAIQKKAQEKSPDLSNKIIEVILNAAVYENIKLEIMPIFAKVREKFDAKLGEFSQEDRDRADSYLREFLNNLESNGKTLLSLAPPGYPLGEELAEMQKEMDAFSEAKGIPPVAVQNAFMFLVSKEWFEAKQNLWSSEFGEASPDTPQLKDFVVGTIANLEKELQALSSETLDKAVKYRQEFLGYLGSDGKTIAMVGEGLPMTQLAQFNQKMKEFWQMKGIDSIQAWQYIVTEKWIESKEEAWDSFFKVRVDPYFIGTFDYNQLRNIWLWTQALEAVFTRVPEGKNPGEIFEENFASSLRNEGLNLIEDQIKAGVIGVKDVFFVKSVALSLQ